MTTAMMTKIKTAMRISGTAYDAQLTALYDAAVQDMIASGVPAAVAGSEACRPAECAILYIKAHFSMSPEEQAAWQPLYDANVAKLAIDSAVAIDTAVSDSPAAGDAAAASAAEAEG